MGKSIWSLGRLSGCHLTRISVQAQKRHFQMHSQEGPSKEEITSVKLELHGKLCRENIRLLQQYPIPEVNNTKVQAKRSDLFTKEKARQANLIGRIEKITVDYQGSGLPESATLIMNKKISTPHNCAQHLGTVVVDNSIAAKVNGNLWDMHRPIEDNCSLRFLSMKSKDEDLYHANRIFWRSCSFMIGACCESAFRDHIYIELHSFPSPNVRSGSFIYDVDLKLHNWVPNSDETRVLSAEMIKLSRNKVPFERLEIDKNLALEMFQDNKYKTTQIPEIAQSSTDGKTICVYRCGNFVDITKGPLMANTGHLGKCTITAVHQLSGSLYRIQGIALPFGFHLNHFAYSLIERRGRQLNTARIPTLKDTEITDESSQTSVNSDSNIEIESTTEKKISASASG